MYCNSLSELSRQNISEILFHFCHVEDKKSVKRTTTGVKWKNQGRRRSSLAAGESAGGSASLESESRPHTRWRVEEFAGEKIGTWRLVDHWLMLGFLSVGRSGLGTPGVGVAGQRWSSSRKSLPGNFPGSRGSLMVAEDSRDGGELAGVRYDH